MSTFIGKTGRAGRTTISQRIEPGAMSTCVTSTAHAVSVFDYSRSRLLLRIDRIALASADVVEAIPTPVGKQFVVDKSARSAVEEASARELFWYREAFLRAFEASWQEVRTRDLLACGIDAEGRTDWLITQGRRVTAGVAPHATDARRPQARGLQRLARMRYIRCRSGRRCDRAPGSSSSLIRCAHWHDAV
jgi:hypothetical protein